MPAHDGVVLLHGIWNYERRMRPVARALETAGYATLNLSYPSLSATLDEIAHGLAPRITAFSAGLKGDLHFIGHSLGGLVIRRTITLHRPATLGKIIMIGTPNHGSETADLAYTLHVDRLLLGKMGRFLRTQRTVEDEEALGILNAPLGIIAGDRPGFPNIFAPCFATPNDGKVSVASTQLRGMIDHITLPIAHDALPAQSEVHRQILAFLKDSRFLKV